jgi:hypothetical protein
MVEATVDPDLALIAGEEREPCHVETIDLRTERPDVKSS